MRDIAELADGNFYYIENTDRIDECFVDAVASLFSVVSQNINIRIKSNLNHPAFGTVSIKKCYGNALCKELKFYNDSEHKVE